MREHDITPDSLAAELAAQIAHDVAGRTPGNGVSPAEGARRRREREQRDAAHARRDTYELKQRVWHEAVGRIVPDLSATAAWEPDDSPSVNAVERWIRAGHVDKSGRRSHMLIHGPKGTGKSVAAAVAVRHWAEPASSPHAGDVLYLSDSNELVGIMQGWDDRPPLSHFVVLDDLGDETHPDFARSLKLLLQRRDVVILATSNLSPAALSERYFADADRLADRLAERFILVYAGNLNRRPRKLGW